MDSSEFPVHGNQEGSSHNGHFCSRCYHPLFVFNQFGDCEGAVLRPGNVHSAEGWRDLLEPIVDGYKDTDKKLYFRGDAAFASPDIYEYLEDKGILYAIRLKVFFHTFSYRVASWTKSRRVVTKVEWHAGEPFPRIGFIVTNMSRTPENVVRFYNQRGTCEQHIKEGKYALPWTRLSCTRFFSNQVRLALFVLAYNLGNFLRRFAPPGKVSHWSLRSVQLRLNKIGARVIRHSRRTIFQCAEIAVSEALFESLLLRIRSLATLPT